MDVPERAPAPGRDGRDLDRLTVGYLAVDRALRCTVINAAGARLLGRTGEAILGRVPWRTGGGAGERAMAHACHQAMRDQQPALVKADLGRPPRGLTLRIFPDQSGLTILFDEAASLPGVETLGAGGAGARELLALHETAVDLGRQVDVDGVLQRLLQRAADLTQTDHGYVYLVDERGELAVIRAGTGAFVGLIGFTATYGEGIGGGVWASANPLIVEDYGRWPGRMDWVPEVERIHAVCGVPLLVGRRVAGVLGVATADPARAFGPDTIATLERLARLATIALENATVIEAFRRELGRRRETEAALREAETRFRTLVEQLPAAVYVLDLDEPVRNRYASPQAELVTGIPEADWVDLHHFLAHVHPDDRARVDASVMRARDERPAAPIEDEYRVVDADGRIRTLVDRMVVYRDPAGGVAGVLGLVSDVTETRAQEAAHWRAASLETVGRLAGGIAHDFNNILTAILGRAELLLDSLSRDDRRRLDAAAIQDAAERAAQLTRRLLQFGRPQPAELAIVDVGTLVRDLGPFLTRTLGETIRVVIEAPSEPDAWTAVDRSQLEQAIVNLATNARDAMPDGGTLTLRVRTGFDPDGASRVLLDVADTGVGMTPEVLAHLFEPYFTTKPAGKGTGLGLAIVLAFATSAGGRLDTITEPGAGTTMTLVLASSAAPDAISAEPARLPSRERPSGAIVLLAEDEAEVRHLVRRSLVRAGYHVVDVPTGEEALAWLQAPAHHADILVTDLVMPGMNGRQLMEGARAIQPNLPMLGISGYASEEILAGLNAPVLAKPFTAAELAAAIQATMDGLPRPPHGSGADQGT